MFPEVVVMSRNGDRLLTLTRAPEAASRPVPCEADTGERHGKGQCDCHIHASQQEAALQRRPIENGRDPMGLERWTPAPARTLDRMMA